MKHELDDLIDAVVKAAKESQMYQAWGVPDFGTEGVEEREALVAYVSAIEARAEAAEAKLTAVARVLAQTNAQLEAVIRELEKAIERAKWENGNAGSALAVLRGLAVRVMRKERER